MVGMSGCRDCAGSSSGICAQHGAEQYLRVSYTGEVEAAKARLAESPHRCPICGGNGLVRAGFYMTTSGVSTTGGTGFEECRTCHGEGIVWRS